MHAAHHLQLNIWCPGHCTVQLTWGNRQQLSANLPSPTLVLQKYQAWQQCYRHQYAAPHRGRAAEEGAFSTTIDWGQVLIEDEQALRQQFQQWLGGQALLAIRHKIQALASLTIDQPYPGVTLLIACHDLEMMRLPWETWDLSGPGVPADLIRIGRTPITVSEMPPTSVSRAKRPRVLTILSEAPDLNLQADRHALRSLNPVADLTMIQRQPSESAQAFKQRLIKQIIDDRGWELLIFVGHSDETELTGGRIHLAPDIALSMGELEPHLQQAQRQGLRAAIFNSCCGLRLAQALIQVGISQVVVMREPVPDEIAQVFLKQICQHLVTRHTLHSAVLAACHHFQTEHLAFPSANLVPSIFIHPQAQPYVLQRSKWQRWRQEWQPARWELMTLGSALFLSLLVPLQDLLLESRTLIQAMYRDQVHERLFPLPPTTTLPPIRIIAIDQDSINRALEQFENFRDWPMDRRYLAQIIDRLTQANTQVVGIDYELYTQEPGNLALNQALRNAVQQQHMWLVLAANRHESRQVLTKTASPNWSLMGDIRFFPWLVRWPDDTTCTKHCPFAYALTIAHHLQHNSANDAPQPGSHHQPTLQASVSQYVRQNFGPKRLFTKMHGASDNTLIDFSLPPNRVYEWVPAWRFLQAGEPGPYLKRMRQQQVVIIASGGYEGAEDNFSIPMAISYWCQTSQGHIRKQPNCPASFTGGEAQAYMTHHFLKGHHIVLIPDWCTLGLAALLGKCTLLFLRQRSQDQRQQLRRGLSGLPLLYGICVTQLYISASVAIPWFWPAMIYWSYIMSARRNRNVAP